MFYLFLADGFEEIEALTTVDILRRAGIKILTVGIGKKNIKGAHGIIVTADITEEETDINFISGVILPGGMPGTINLEHSQTVRRVVNCAVEKGLYIAAICAAPSVLGKMGVLEGRKAVCYPGFENELKGAIVVDDSVVADGNIITGKGAGAALEFALLIVEIVCSKEKAEEVRNSIKWRQ